MKIVWSRGRVNSNRIDSEGSTVAKLRPRHPYTRAMKIDAKTPQAYLDAVPADRRPHLVKLRALVKKAVPAAKEVIMWNMIGWTIDERPFAALASQKNYLTLHLMDLYTQ